MADISRRITAIAATALVLAGSLCWSASAADSGGNGNGTTVNLTTVSSGSHQWDYLTATTHKTYGSSTENVPTRRGAYCYFSHWLLSKVNPVSRSRYYAVYIYNACDSNRQITPTNANQCINDDGHHANAIPSTCVTIDPGHIPVGLPPDACNANAEASVALHAKLDPPAYDARQGAALTATTSFDSDFMQRLSEAECTDIIDWQTIGWTLVWPDGHTDQLPPSGRNGTTSTHTMPGNPSASGSVPSDVTAVAHLHIHGTALDFDPGGNVVTVTRDAFVDISNKASANGDGAAPVYTPPQLVVGGIGLTQNVDGTLPPLSSGGAAETHLDAIYGRLLRVYPRAIVVTPGTESIGGVVIGNGRTATTTWTYTGGWTDAPGLQATPPGTSGSAANFLQVQYNHAERLNATGHKVDETVPLRITATTTYPDGNTITTALNAGIPVTIYYVGLDNAT